MCFQWGNYPICSLWLHPFVHILGLLPGLEINYSSLPHPGCQETIDMHSFNYDSIEFCGACFIFICISQAAHRRHYAHYSLLCTILFWQILRKAFHIFFCTACHHAVLCGLESLFAGSIYINVKLFSLYLCSGLLDCEICQSHINKYVLCASWRYFHIFSYKIWSKVCWTQLKYSNWPEQFVLSERARWIQLFINHLVFSKGSAQNMHLLKKTTNSYSRDGNT